MDTENFAEQERPLILPPDLKNKLIKYVEDVFDRPLVSDIKEEYLNAIEASDPLELLALWEHIDNTFTYRAEKFPEERNYWETVVQELKDWLDESTRKK